MIDLSEHDIIDVHTHRPEKKTMTETYESWTPNFVESMIPSYDFDNKKKLQKHLYEVFSKHMQFGSPRVRGLLNYVSKTNGCKPSVKELDNIISKNIHDNFGEYLKSVMGREKITNVVLDLSRLVDHPVGAIGDMPSDRTKWTYNIGPLLQPKSIEERGTRSIGEAANMVNEVVQEAVKNGCAGLKNSMAYFRPLSITQVNEEQADEALKWILTNEPKSFTSFPTQIPRYNDPKGARMLRTYQDYILTKIYASAGKVNMPFLIHIASALHPALTPEYNNPLGLYSVLANEQIREAGTTFIILHTGYPLHHQVATILSQFPNVYADVSFFSQYPAILEEVLRTFLQLAPPQKVMHGSDSNSMVEVMAYSAYNTKRILSKVLNDFAKDYEWTEDQCLSTARMVLSENAKRIFNIN